MRTLVFDRQNDSNPRSGCLVASAATIQELFAEARGRDPFFLELVSDTGYNLLIGIGAEVGCAQFSATDGSPPYFMAVSGSPPIEDDYMDFLIADTPTPVARRFCLPLAKVEVIAADFVDSGQRSQIVEWEEI